MAALSKKLRNVIGLNSGKGFAHWCPGCDGAHVIYHTPPSGYDSGAIWQWDGNVDAPTVAPSVRLWVPAMAGRPERTTCHYFLRGGQIEFCGDSAHALAGKTVPLPDWPRGDGEYGGVEP